MREWLVYRLLRSSPRLVRSAQRALNRIYDEDLSQWFRKVHLDPVQEEPEPITQRSVN